jgi:N-acetyl-anhydromuramyl-L-alanine amidase AmpD
MGSNKPIEVVVIHCTAGAEPGVAGAARGTVAYTKRSGVVSSYHYVADAKESVQAVWDSVVAYHCGGRNTRSIGYELSCSLSDEGQGHWDRDDHKAMLRIAAHDVARLCLAYNVPITRLTPSQLREGAKGICGHVDVRSAFPGTTTHWDPGPHFPWAGFISMVKSEAADLLEPDKPVKPKKPEKPIEKLGVHLLLGGDWNEGANSTGTHSPAWIAAQGGMKVYAPPPNRAGKVGIDYVLSSAPVTDVKRVEETGSDHEPITFTVTHPDGRTLRGGIFNVRRDRTLAEREQLHEWLDARDEDFWLLQEVRQYHDLLKSVGGYTAFTAREPAGAEHNAVLVRDGVTAADAKFRQTSGAGWFTKDGKQHDPTTVALVTLNGWLRVGSVHEVVSTDLRAGKWVGPVRRVAARVSSAQTLARIGRYWKARR